MIVHKEPSSFLPLVGLAFFCFVQIGGIGGATGVLLPSQIAYYHVNTSIINLLFFTFSIGYILSAGTLVNTYRDRPHFTRVVSPFSLSFTHIFQMDFMKRPEEQIVIVDCFTASTVLVRSTGDLKKMWVRIRFLSGVLDHQHLCVGLL